MSQFNIIENKYSDAQWSAATEAAMESSARASIQCLVITNLNVFNDSLCSIISQPNGMHICANPPIEFPHSGNCDPSGVYAIP